jgi:predicted ribosomally synthesized peptide with nif11-like leader
MSWSELERLVSTAEADSSLRRALRRSRSQEELVLAARRLGYRITRQDLAAAVEEHRAEGVPAPASGR